MASIPEINIKIVGVGRGKFGLWLLGVIARIFQINLEVREE